MIDSNSKIRRIRYKTEGRNAGIEEGTQDGLKAYLVRPQFIIWCLLDEGLDPARWDM